MEGIHRFILQKNRSDGWRFNETNMAWYDRLLGRTEKLNPAQEEIVYSLEGSGPIQSREIPRNYTSYYETLEVVNRGVNMITDDAADWATLPPVADVDAGPNNAKVSAQLVKKISIKNKL